MRNSHDIVARFRAVVRENGQRAAIEFAGRSYSYDSLDRCSDELALRICERGIQYPGNIAVIDCERSPSLVLAVLACVKARLAFFVIGENQPEAYVARVIGDLEDVFWLGAAGYSDPEKARRIAGDRLGGCCIFAGSELERPTDGHHAQLTGGLAGCTAQREAHGMYLVATSGTTGRPKLVFTGMEPVVNFIDWYRRTFALFAADKFSMLSGLGYDPLIRDIFTPLCIGACICIPGKEVLGSRRGLRDWINERRISVIHATPQIADVIFHWDESGSFESVRLVMLGGAALPRRLATRVKSRLPLGHLVNAYGTSETPQVMTYHVVEGACGESGTVPVGKPIDGVNVQILDEEGAPVAPHEIGEIHIATPHLSMGYYGDPDLTAGKFGSSEQYGCRSYRSGDLGYLDPEGNLNFVGRKDRQVKHRGYRMRLEEIEQAMLTLDEVLAAAVVLDGTAGPDKLVCYLQYKSGRQPKLSDIKQKISTLLPTYMIPDRYVALERMPLGGGNKIDYAALTGAAVVAPAGSSVTVLAKDHRVAAQLRSIWSEVLGVSTAAIGMDSNFFEVGGTSLHSAQVVECINRLYAKNLKVTDLFVYSNIGDLSEYIAAAGPARESPVVASQAGKRVDSLNRIGLERTRRMQEKP
jgi:amino acid adenylation domain-containing protein